MEIEESKKVLLEKIYSLIDDVVDGFRSEKVRIKFKKDIIERFEHKLSKDELRRLYPMLNERTIYELMKSIKVLEEDPYKPKEFVTYKSRWREFREKLKQS